MSPQLQYIAGSLLIFVLLLVPLLYLRRRLRQWGEHMKEDVARALRRRLVLPLFLLIATVAARLPLRLVAPEPELAETIEHLLSILLIVFISCTLVQAVALARRALLLRYDLGVRDNLRARRVFTQFKVLESIVVFLIVLVALSLVLMSFEGIRRIGVSLLASAGVAGVVIGFAAQKVIVTILAGIQIAITQPIRIDDVVIVENEWGWIDEINLTYVVVRIWDKRRLVLPTTYFIETPFQNWTRSSAEILGTVFIYADYTLPVESVRQELARILENHAYWDGQVSNVQVTNASERTVEIRILLSAADSPSAWNLRVDVRERMLAFLQRQHPECLPRARVELQKHKAGS